MRPSRLYPAFFGYALLFAYKTVCRLEAAPAFEEARVPEGAVYSAAVCLVGLACALLSGRLYPLRARRGLAECATAVQAGVGAASLAAGAAMPCTAALACSVALAASYAVLLLCWYELFCRLEASSAVLHFAAANMLSSAAIVAASAAGLRWPASAALLALPVCALACLRKAASQVDAAAAAGAPGAEAVSGSWAFPVKPAALLALVTFANLTVRSYMAPGTQGLAAAGVFAALLPVAVLAARGRTVSTPPMLGASLVLMAAGALSLLLEGRGFSDAGAMCANGAFALLSLAVFAVFCRASYRFGVNPLWLFGFELAAEYGGKAAAKLGEAAIHAAPDVAVPVAALVMLVVAAFAAVLADPALAEGFAVARRPARPTGPAGSAAPEPLDVVVLRCSALARRHDLTRREEEVLFCLAQGMGPAETAERLCVAESTVKSHVKHIYAKTGVHSREELARLTDTSRPL